MNDNDEFDHVLDEALAQYRDAEPLAGMEQRVLQRVRLHAEHRWKLWRWWGAFAACAAMLAVAAWIGLRDRASQEIIAKQPATTQQQRPPVESRPKNVNTYASQEPAPRRALVAKAPSRSPNVAGPALSTSTKQAPVRSQFPSPTPLNSEERALLALAQTHPETLSHLQSNQDDREIAIAPINIQPLVNETSRQQGEN
jgi:cytoskeletal protein RodZ